MKTLKFTTPNIEAIERGTKTQTRRPIKPQLPACWRDVSPDELGGGAWMWGSPANDERHVVAPPYAVGDLVRVTAPDGEPTQPALVIEITAVRCERLREISGGDATAEGAPIGECWGPGCRGGPDGCNARGCEGARDWFERLWGTIYGPDSEFAWQRNCWVLVYEFRKVPNAES